MPRDIDIDKTKWRRYERKASDHSKQLTQSNRMSPQKEKEKERKGNQKKKKGIKRNTFTPKSKEQKLQVMDA